MTDFPNELVTYQDFFNFEAERIVDLSQDQLRERIKQYNKIMYAVKSFEHATTRRLLDLAGEERARVLKEDFNYVPEAPKKQPVRAKSGQPRMSKQEKSINSIMNLLGVSREEAEQMVQKNK